MYKLLVIGLLLLSSSAASAQIQPQSAHVNMYFPQLADGGPQYAQWQTTFTFVNAGATEAKIEILTIGDDGRDLLIDMGMGPRARHIVGVPPRGSRTLQSTKSSPDVRIGWAVAYSNVPVQGLCSFRLWLDGRASQEVTAPASLPTTAYVSSATRDTGVAIANPYSRTVSVDLSLFGAQGALVGQPARITLGPYGHTAFNIYEKFPGASPNSTILLRGVDRPTDSFVGWSMNSSGTGTFSSIPGGSVPYPLSHQDRIWNVYLRVYDAARRLGILTSMPTLAILQGKEVNAYAAGGETVAISLGLSQLINDSDAEMAAVIGHELVHIYQQRNGGERTFHTNPEFDADMGGTWLAVAAGYDPYALAGTLAKLSMATGTAGLSTQFEMQSAADAHKSFNERIAATFEMLVGVCNKDAASRAACAEYKKIMHPNLPDNAPLHAPNEPVAPQVPKGVLGGRELQ